MTCAIYRQLSKLPRLRVHEIVAGYCAFCYDLKDDAMCANPCRSVKNCDGWGVRWAWGERLGRVRDRRGDKRTVTIFIEQEEHIRRDAGTNTQLQRRE